MPPSPSTSDLRCAADPAVDAVAQRIVAAGVAAVGDDADVAALLLTGSLAYGNACGLVAGARAWLLSDVDFVVVPRSGARASLRADLLTAVAGIHAGAADLGLASHVEFGLLSQRTLAQPPPRLFLCDLARRGVTLAGDPALLAGLRARLEGRSPRAREGIDLARNRIAGALWMLDQVGDPDPVRRLVLRYQFCKAYADSVLAVETVAATRDAGPARARLVAQQARAARWHAWRRAPDPEPGPPAELFADWRVCLADQLDVAQALGDDEVWSPRAWLRDAASWRRLPSARLRQRLGLGGSPLAAAHAASLALAAELLAADGAGPDWIARARAAGGLWRVALNAHDDTHPDWCARVGALLAEVG